MFVNLETILFQAQPSAGGSMMSLLFMVGMIAVMYFFLIRPQAKRAKEQKKFAESIGAGEKVITSAGIHGVISRINEDGTLQIEVGRGTFLTIERSAVSMELTAAARKKAEGAAAVATK
jgi:preprotein translocase subunit YajC